MDDVPSAINDPIFNLHHCNVDRIFGSWLQRFAQGHTSPELLPAYVTVSGGHPGHNCDNCLVPFFAAGGQYLVAIEWGYIYDELIPPLISDDDIPNCSSDNCSICDANMTSRLQKHETCPPPYAIELPDDHDKERALACGNIELGLAVGLGGPLFIALGVTVVGTVVMC